LASNASVAGAALFAGMVQFGIALMLAEVYYPGYNVSTNYISDLGATCNTTCVIHQPSSLIFNSSVILMGVLVLLSAAFVQRALHVRSFALMLTIAGLGAVGVGLFPESTGNWHLLFSLVTFLFAGLSAVVSFGVARGPLSYFSGFLGLTTLAALVLYAGKMYLGLGPGGMERMIVYPVLLWAIGFGGYLMSAQDWPKSKQQT
jgi:hypothetical membrane protein